MGLNVLLLAKGKIVGVCWVGLLLGLLVEIYICRQKNLEGCRHIEGLHVDGIGKRAPFQSETVFI